MKNIDILNIAIIWSKLQRELYKNTLKDKSISTYTDDDRINDVFEEYKKLPNNIRNLFDKELLALKSAMGYKLTSRIEKYLHSER